MAKTTLRNLHVPLSDDLYSQLCAEAERAQQPATVLARQAIAWRLELQRKRALHDSIQAYAAQNAGTEADLDHELATAAVEHLLTQEEKFSAAWRYLLGRSGAAFRLRAAGTALSDYCVPRWL